MYLSAGMRDGGEGLSLAVLDHLEPKLPIVATNISGNKDIVKDGRSGILVKLGNVQQMAAAVAFLLKNRTIAKDYGKAAFEISRQYHWSSIAEQYLKVYRNATDRSQWIRASCAQKSQ